MVSNSLDIDFIRGDIHGRSCKNTAYDIEYQRCHIIQSDIQVFLCPHYAQNIKAYNDSVWLGRTSDI